MQAFPHENLKLLYSTHSGVTCPYPPGAEHRALPPAVPRMPDGAPDASKPPRRTACDDSSRRITGLKLGYKLVKNPWEIDESISLFCCRSIWRIHFEESNTGFNVILPEGIIEE